MVELTLGHSPERGKVSVICNGHPSHTLALQRLLLDESRSDVLPPQLNDPVRYGRKLYDALFPAESIAHETLEQGQGAERLFLVLEDETAHTVPWEYAYGPEGFLVADRHVVRGLPLDKRVDLPSTFRDRDESLHILAIPSNPLSEDVDPLNIEGEWQRLRQVVGEVKGNIVLERVRPPTLEQLMQKANEGPAHVIHFMGHGRQRATGATLLFENAVGGREEVRAIDFERTVRGGAFLVTLNACVSARPGPTTFSNAAAALAERGVPYVLGMRLSIPDEDARSLSRLLYSSLARGRSIEESMRQARFLLARGERPWAVGAPVLYTALGEPASGFRTEEGEAHILENRPPMEAYALPRAEGAFQGRVAELLALGERLTGDERPDLLTIHGAGGQGKTALAREAVDRFAHAFPGGVWATSLEELPAPDSPGEMTPRQRLASDLARFLGVETEGILDSGEVERRLWQRLGQRRFLFVLDNAETLVQAVEDDDAQARDLADLIRKLMTEPGVSLLATSRRPFDDWPGEELLPLEGLPAHDGARLFRQSASARAGEFKMEEAERLSRRVGGHPLSLRLLGAAFNGRRGVTLAAFTEEVETHLAQAADKYREEEDRHRSLYACMDASVRHLEDELRALLSSLWVFHSPFLPEAAVAVFDEAEDEARSNEHETVAAQGGIAPQKSGAKGGETGADEEEERKVSPVVDRLYALRQRGLLEVERETLREGNVLLFRLLPALRPYCRDYLAQALERETLLGRFGLACAANADFVERALDRGGLGAYLARQMREDLDRGWQYVKGESRVRYLRDLGWMRYRLGESEAGLALTERALEQAQGRYPSLAFQAGNTLAIIYQSTGHPQRALQLYEEALPLLGEVGDRAGQAATLNNMAGVYQNTGGPQRALQLYEQALPLTREVGDRAGEATTLNNMAGVYRATGHPQRALGLFEQALPIRREVGDRAGEATTLNNMALVYQNTGQLQRALALFEEALPLRREVGDRAGEATTLHNMALVFRATGQPQRALQLYEQALPIRREVGDRAGEATTLNNMAGVYQDTGHPQRALRLFEEALLLTREVGDRAGEAKTLSNMAGVYQATGQPEHALELFEEALPLRREVGDRAGEAATLNGMAYLAMELQRYQVANSHFQASIDLMVQAGHPAGEAAGLVGLSILLYRHLGQPQTAVQRLEEAISVLKEVGLERDAAGQTQENLRQVLARMRRGEPLSDEPDQATMPSEQIQTIVSNTVAVMTAVPEKRDEWREAITERLEHAHNQGQAWQIEVDFFSAVLAILDDEAPALPHDHPYAGALADIQEGSASGGPQGFDVPDDVPEEVAQAVQGFLGAEDWAATRRVMEERQEALLGEEAEALLAALVEQAEGDGNEDAARFFATHRTLLRDCREQGIEPAFARLQAAQQQARQQGEAQHIELPFPDDLLQRTVAALRGGPQEKMAHAQYLSQLNLDEDDAELQAFLAAIQTALFGGDLASLESELRDPYRQVWQAIRTNVEADVDPALLGKIMQNTLSVLGPAEDRRDEWRKGLQNLKEEAGDQVGLQAFIDDVLALLAAGGNPADLGQELQGIYAQAWQAIVENLTEE